MSRSKIKRQELKTIEDKIFRTLLISANRDYQEFRDIYMRSGKEFRPVYQRDEDGKPIYDSDTPPDLETVDVSYITFKEWFVRRGLKLRRILMFLDLLKYRMVIVPKNAKVTVSYTGIAGERMYGAAAPKEDETVQIFSVSDKTDTIEISEASAGEEPIVVRMARKDKSQNIDKANSRFPNVQKAQKADES